MAKSRTEIKWLFCRNYILFITVRLQYLRQKPHKKNRLYKQSIHLKLKITWSLLPPKLAMWTFEKQKNTTWIPIICPPNTQPGGARNPDTERQIFQYYWWGPRKIFLSRVFFSGLTSGLEILTSSSTFWRHLNSIYNWFH